MANVASILMAKMKSVHTVRADETVFAAVRRMVGHDVGALVVVTREGRFSGIITERDYLRCTVLEGRNSQTTTVDEIMTRNAPRVTPETSADQCARIMTDRRVGHLSVTEGDTPVGVVSIGDVVKMQSSEHTASIEQMTQYIQGRA